MNPPSKENHLGLWFRLGCVYPFLLIVLVVAGWIYIDSQRGWSVSRLEASIALEVPADADQRTAEKWFDRHGIEHSYFVDTTSDRYGHSTMPMLA